MALFVFSGCNQQPKIVKAPLIPLEDFFKNPEKSSYKISPGGTYFSFKAPYEKRMNIFVQKIGADSAIRLTSETDRDIAGYFWANDNYILYLKDQGGDENFRLYGVNADGSNLTCYTPFEGVRTQIIDDLPEFPDDVIIGMNKRDPQVFDPYRLNVKTGQMKQLAENPGNIQQWIFDHEAKLRAAIAIVDGVNNQVLYRETEKDEFKPILTTSFKETMAPVMFTFDNKNVFALSNLGRDMLAVIVFDIKNGKEVEVLYENPGYDLDGVQYSKKRKVLTYVTYESDKTQRHYFDEESRNMMQNLEKKLAGYEFAVSSETDNEDRFMIRTYSDRSLGTYYVYDKNTDALSKIVDVSPWINENEMSTEFPVQYTSRDGLTINAYLTLPKGYTLENAKNLPTVINPHGGPWARDYWGFNPEVQFLANRGYAVFQMNFRGSTGYGKKFWEAGFKKWGLEMQNDITDGTKWLMDKGIADKSRIAIYGGSYGGYATLMGIVKEPDLYTAAVDYVGVSNLFTFMKTIPPYWKPYLDMFYEMVGNPQADSTQLAATSPVFNADKIKTPLFIAQGANDPRVNKNESDQMVEALKARGIIVEYLVKDNEGHGFQNEENRFDFYRAMEKFLNTNLKMQE
ncbi:MAG: S9 family peptidase [Bacteroidetes bacterium]|nr:S9 family peptidase [Bacteroidota bacterium]